MRDRGRGGRIINIASTASVQAWHLQSVYGASKGAVALLTRCMAIELGQYGICVNAVGPGTIVTPGSKEFLSDERVLANELGRVALDRLGQPEDIATAVRYLARDARWTTGQTIYVDGGFLAAGLTVPR
jgi:NAD(P)-dependent dehydrogenase (short-subunit alcohol dehydrogenase family)